MIYRIYRKDPNVRSQTQMNKPFASQSLFIQQISRIIKLVKKREDLFMRLLQDSARADTLDFQYSQRYSKQYQSYLQESKNVMNGLLAFKKEGFFCSNSYLYTIFMRLQELFDINRKICQIRGQKDVENTYDTIKKALAQIYHNQTYEQNYSVIEIIEFVNKNQSARLLKFFYKKKTASKLMPVNLSQKFKQSNSHDNQFIRKTISVEIFKNNVITLDDVINRKLGFKQESAQKRLSEQKIIKPKKTNLTKLYNILDMKSGTIQKFGALNCYELEIGMNERNEKIKEQIKKWEKKYLCFKNSQNNSQLHTC